MKKTDLQILRALLSLPMGKISPREKQVFQGMYDSVATGQVINLSKKQRLWAESVYDKLELGKRPQPPARKVEVKDKQLLKFPKIN
jgi:hypothetical protein